MAATLEFIFQEAMVKAGVVCNEQAAIESLQNLARHLLESRGIGNHVVGNAGQRLNKRRDQHAWIDQAAPFPHTAFVDCNNTDFGNPIGRCRGPGGFKVNKSETVF